MKQWKLNCWNFKNWKIKGWNKKGLKANKKKLKTDEQDLNTEEQDIKTTKSEKLSSWIVLSLALAISLPSMLFADEADAIIEPEVFIHAERTLSPYEAGRLVHSIGFQEESGLKVKYNRNRQRVSVLHENVKPVQTKVVRKVEAVKVIEVLPVEGNPLSSKCCTR